MSGKRDDSENVFRLSQPDAMLRQDLTETAKTHSLKPLDRSAPISKTRHTLPHWTQDGCTYFVTFRLADSVAADVWRRWREQRAIWHEAYPKPWDADTQKAYNAKFPAQMELWADAGYGSCVLKNEDLRAIVVKAMHHFAGEHFTLGDYAIMPNHVHVLVTPHPDHSLESILTGWKRVSGHAILKRTGMQKPFWMSEDFDHVVRSERQLKHFQNYIAENPVKANLRAGTWTYWKSS